MKSHNATIFFAVVACLVVFAAVAHAEMSAGRLNLNRLGDKNERQVAAGIITWLKSLAAAILIIIVIYGGIRMMTSAGNEAEAGEARKILLYGAIGLGVVLLGEAILAVIRETLGY